MDLTRRDERELTLQSWVSFLCLPLLLPLFVGTFRLVRGYHYPELRQLRTRVAESLAAKGDGPLLICPNHLTMIDSMLLTWLLFDWRRYLRGPRSFPWHAPEFANFARNLPLRVMCFLGRCLFVRRGGDRAENRRIIAQFAALLRRGAAIFIFPEGTRSRTGRVEADQVTYSVGQLYNEVPHCHVLCVYLRGAGQATFGFLPRRGEAFYVDVQSFAPPPGVTADRRGAREIALGINGVLRDMEARYFASARTADGRQDQSSQGSQGSPGSGHMATLAAP